MIRDYLWPYLSLLDIDMALASVFPKVSSIIRVRTKQMDWGCVQGPFMLNLFMSDAMLIRDLHFYKVLHQNISVNPHPFCYKTLHYRRELLGTLESFPCAQMSAGQRFNKEAVHVCS